MDPRVVGANPETISRAVDHFSAALYLDRDGNGHNAEYHRELGEDALAEAINDNVYILEYDFTGPEPLVPSREFDRKIGTMEAVLIKASFPDDQVSYSIHHHHIGHQVETERYFTIPVQGVGVQYIIIHLEGLAAGQSIHHFAFQRAGDEDPFYWDGLFLDVPEKGSLSVSIHNDEGSDTWSLLRLESLANGRLIVPSGALDLSDIMDNISGIHGANTGRGYNYHSPGPASGVFHVTPGRFEMALPPGKYRITAQKGPEYHVVTKTATVTAKEQRELLLELDRWIDMPKLGWYSGDDHVHAQLLHSNDAERLIAFARASDTHVVNVLEMGNERRTYFEQRGFGPDSQVRSGDYVLVPGQEDPRYMLGHAIGLNMRARVRDLDNYILNDLWADALHEQGALYGHAHVGHKAFDIIRDMTLLIPRGKSDFSTVLQGFLGTDFYFDFLDLGYQHAASAGSDTPYGTGIGSVRVYVYTGDEALDTEDWFAGLAAGRSFVTQGPMLFLTVNGEHPGSRHTLKENGKVDLNLQVKGRPGEFSPATVRIIKNSELIHEVLVPEGENSTNVSLQVSTGHGGWLVAMVEDVHGSEAMTSPVYFEVEGLRPWNHARVPQLLEDRRETLRDISGMLDDIEERHTANQLWLLDYWNRRALDNITGLRARVALVDELLDELEDLHHSEKPQRGILQSQ
ncbi:MAG: CehA/McbA family metallohydrolase [Candidatus Sumerlaeia bacterium]|nr:CehA/McbA family metallohydrolase [Candidatus Sumerlaeia bacterium]